MKQKILLYAIAIISVGILIYLPVFLILSSERRKVRRELGVPGPPWYLVVCYLLLPLAFGLPFFQRFYAWAGPPAPKTNLTAIANAQGKYKSEHGFYAHGDQFFASLDCKLRGDNYNYFCGNEMIDNVVAEGGRYRSCGVGSESPARAERARQDWPLRIRPAASATGFTCLAIGNRDGDVFPDVYMLTDRSGPEHIISDPRNEDDQHLLLPPRLWTERFYRELYEPILYFPYLFPSLAALVFLLLIIDERKYRRAKKAKAKELPPAQPPGL
jgi:hypothetical protein